MFECCVFDSIINICPPLCQIYSWHELVNSLIIGTQDMLATEGPFEPGTEMTMVDVPEPAWIGQHAH